MGKLFLRILLAVLALANTPVSQTSSLPQIGQPELALVGATLIDGTGQAPIRNAVVLVGGGLDYRMGRALTFPKVHHNRLLISLAHGFGHHIEKFGNPDFCAGGPLTGLT